MRDMICKAADGKFVVITEGTGDNLFQEDIDAGFVDYVNYEVYATLEQARENEDAWSLDGGMVYLKELYQDLVISEVLSVMADEIGCPLTYVEDYID